MADSDNSRTLSSVTRRTLLGIAAAQPTGEGDGEDGVVGEGDPALSLWRDWQAANRKACAFGRRQVRLENRLVDAVGFPQIDLIVTGQAAPVTVSTASQIEKWLGDGPDLADERDKAKAELAARRRAWREQDERLGYSRALKAEGEAQAAEQALLETLWQTPAHTCAGAAGKLHAILTAGEPGEGITEFPWPQVRLLLSDLLRIAT